ncbi:MAG: YbaK/EbsC family protein [Clostridia bacterium]|nr:YbaK/EbsC family protein [Clostridia bacterium]
MNAGTERVKLALQDRGFRRDIIELPESARTAAQAASALGCAVAQIAKSLVFRTASGDAILVVASGAHRVDERRLAEAVGEPVALADPEFVRERTGFAIGGVAPVGHLTPLPVWIDRDLLNHDEIWAAAGHPRMVFRLTPSELVALTGGQVIAVR